MGSETIKFPLIDFSELKRECKTLNWESAKSQVRSALEEFGCFEAKFEQIPQDLQNSVFEGLKQLFELPLQNKQRNWSSKPYHGYLGPNAQVPLYESLGIDKALERGSIEAFTNLVWSHENPEFSENIKTFSELLSDLDQMIRKMILESLGLENYLDEHMKSTDYIVRVQKYDPPQNHGTEVGVGLVSHTDKSMITILCPNEINGLEVMTKDGQWIPAQSSPNTFSVMIGDFFHAWTNGRLHSPHHRVMMRGEVARYSIGLFTTPKENYIIKAPEEWLMKSILYCSNPLII